MCYTTTGRIRSAVAPGSSAAQRGVAQRGLGTHMRSLGVVVEAPVNAMLIHLCLPLVNIRLRYLVIEITILNQNLAAGVVAIGVIKELRFVFLIAYPASAEVGRAVFVSL